jgi:hypothetical protein
MVELSRFEINSSMKASWKTIHRLNEGISPMVILFSVRRMRNVSPERIRWTNTPSPYTIGTVDQTRSILLERE